MSQTKSVHAKPAAHPPANHHKNHPVKKTPAKPAPSAPAANNERAAASSKNLKAIRGGNASTAPAPKLREHKTTAPQFRLAEGEGWKNLPPAELNPKRAEGSATRATGGPVRQPKEMTINGHVYIKNGQVVR